MLIYRRYDRNQAVRYARRWALSRNPIFGNFDGMGGDCTNFVSQCVYAGCCVMDYTPVMGWFYSSMAHRAPAWSGVKFFYEYLTGTGGYIGRKEHAGPYGRTISIDRAEVGDVIQLADKNGVFYHTLLISAVSEGGVYVCAHTYDALDRPLATYEYGSLRVIHIEEAHAAERRSDCFEGLISGRRRG